MPQKGDPHKVFRPTNLQDMQNADSSYVTKGFLIRYCEEEVEINDCALFRDEIELDSHLLGTEVFVEFELFFSDLSKMNGPINCMKFNAKPDFEQMAEFKPVQKQTYKLVNACKGLCEFVPVQFTNYYHCLVNV